MPNRSGIHKIAGLRISRIDRGPRPEPQRSSTFPKLVPPEDRLRREKRMIFRSDSINLSHDSAMEDQFDPSLREEQNDLVARVTVYVINLCIMVFLLPVGLAMLCLNILGGANLRTTAHVMALTGLFMALASTDQGSQMLWMI